MIPKKQSAEKQPAGTIFDRMMPGFYMRPKKTSVVMRTNLFAHLQIFVSISVEPASH